MSKKNPSGSPGQPFSDHEFAVYDCLLQRHDFMKSAEIVVATDIAPGSVLAALDGLYASRLIMARFALQGQAIIVTCDEVRSPEVGFSRKLDGLLAGIGMNRGNWVDVSKAYAALNEGGGYTGMMPDGMPSSEMHPLLAE